MMQDDTFQPEFAADSGDNSGEVRTPRAIRFSESEWARIKKTANQRGQSFGGFVRHAALFCASEQSGTDSAAISPGIEELIKQTFRYAFVLATIKRDEIITEGHQNTIDDMIARARAAEAELLIANEPPQ